MKRTGPWIFLACAVLCVACSTSSDAELATLADVTSLSDVPSTSDDGSQETGKSDIDGKADPAGEAVYEELQELVQDLGPTAEATPEPEAEITEPGQTEIDEISEPESTTEVDLEPQPEVVPEIEPELEVDAEVEAEAEIIDETTTDLGPEVDADAGPEVSSCVDDPAICDDDNPCTQTWCGQGGICASVCNCMWTCASNPDCSQDDLCITTTCQTVGDAQCGGSECVWEAVDCAEPDDPCWTAACESDVGCVDIPDDWADCDDGDPYTTNDHCLNGSCYGSCEPDCAGPNGAPLDCGPDGCGGSCGDCADYHACEAASCEEVCPPLCGSLPSCEGPVVHAGHGYYFCKKARTYNEALQFCADNNAHLVTITSEAENNAVADLASDAQRVWLGLDDKAEEGNFAWTTGEEMTWDDWAFSEPNNGWLLSNQDCVHLTTSSGKWRDDNCDGDAAAVCEVE